MLGRTGTSRDWASRSRLLSMVEPQQEAPTARLGPVTLPRVLAIIAALGALVMVALMLWASGRGIDFTDEGYYLVSMATPDLAAPSVTQFGFVYHPLFELVGSDITRMRQLNVVLTFGLAWLLSDLVVRLVLGGREVPRWQRVSLSAALACGSLALFGTVWVLTPSYNGLALQALMLVGIGVLLSVTTDRSVVWVMALIGVGGWLAFLAKPTTALAAGVLVVVFALLVRKPRLILGSAAVASGLLVGTAFAIDGSVRDFITRVQSGADILAALGGSGHTLAETVRIDPLDMGVRLILVSVAFAVTIGLLATAVLLARPRTRLALLGLAILSGAIVGLLGQGHWRDQFGDDEFRKLVLLSIPLAAVLAAATMALTGRRRLTRAELGVAAVLFLMPAAYVVGTNNNYWMASGSAALLWILAGLVLLGVARELDGVVTTLALLGIGTQVLTAALLVQAADKPYRQVDPIRDNTVATRVGPDGASLKLTADFAAYVDDAREVAAEAGFVPGTPLIDLSGMSPTLVYALGGRTIGQAWTIGGYEGSEKAAVMSLAYVDCRDLARAWVLTDPDGARRIPETALRDTGISLSEDHRVAGEWKTAQGASGYPATTQTLWRPNRSAESASEACSVARGEQNGGTDE